MISTTSSFVAFGNRESKASSVLTGFLLGIVAAGLPLRERLRELACVADLAGERLDARLEPVEPSAGLFRVLAKLQELLALGRAERSYIGHRLPLSYVKPPGRRVSAEPEGSAK